MIIFILAQTENDILIIDQPEDDLDNQTVYEDVVKLIQSQKANKQFLLATHNANFPVLGDAEMIVSCAEVDDEIDVLCEGIDSQDCQKRIIERLAISKRSFTNATTPGISIPGRKINSKRQIPKVRFEDIKSI